MPRACRTRRRSRLPRRNSMGSTEADPVTFQRGSQVFNVIAAQLQAEPHALFRRAAAPTA
jgi:hypothetical protein